MITISQKEALTIVQSIKEGRPPDARLVPHLHVGREPWVKGMAWYLDAAKNDELSAVRFIIGEYGSGKTHFLRMTAHMALERRFVVCEVTLSREVRLDRFQTVWQKIIENLATPESEGKPEGMQGLLNRWCQQITQSPDQLTQTLSTLEQAPHLDPDFRQALRGYLIAYIQAEDRDSYLQWFKGDAIKPKGVRGHIETKNARAMLRSLLEFLRLIGYSGLVLFLDELEVIMEQNSKVRDSSYDALRQFIDGSDNLRSFLLLCSATPSMRTNNQKGFPSYAALWQRLGGMLDGWARKDYRAITVMLDEVPLSEADLVELARRLRAFHGLAYDWPADQEVEEEFLRNLVHQAEARTPDFSLPRLVAQATIYLLEAKEQNRGKSLESLIPEALQDALKTIRHQERERYRPWE